MILKLQNGFDGEVEVFNESSLLNDFNEIIRPDKIVYLGDEVHVIDFKTGEEKREHYNQVQDYKDCLGKISSQEIRGFLYYLNGAVLREV